MSGLKREDEHKLNELNRMAEQVGRHNLPEDDLLHLMLLEDRYAHFIEEGMRKLRGEPSSDSNVLKRLIFRKSGAPSVPSSRKPVSGKRWIAESDGDEPRRDLPPQHEKDREAAKVSGRHTGHVVRSDVRRRAANGAASAVDHRGSPSSTGCVSSVSGSPAGGVADAGGPPRHLNECHNGDDDDGTPHRESTSRARSDPRGGDKDAGCAPPPQRNASSSGAQPSSTESASLHVDAVSSALDDSHIVTMSCTLSPPLQFNGKMWTWVTENVIVGAVPYAAEDGGITGHLRELREQCVQRDSVITAVVNCLETDESVPSGFAMAKDWERLLSVVTFFFLPFIPRAKHVNTCELPDSTLEEILTVCNNIKPLVARTVVRSSDRSNAGADHKKRKVVYVHCKTGLDRSWVFAMAYLQSAYCLEYNDAERYLKQLRAFTPSDDQVQLSKRFSDFLASPRLADRTDEEDRYLRVLADVLSLPARYRQRLIVDMEKLT